MLHLVRVFYLLLILLAGFSPQGHASELFKGRKAIFPVVIFPPFFTLDDNGKLTGTHYQIASRLFQELGMEVLFSEMPYSRAHTMIHQGKIVMLQYASNGVSDETDHLLFPLPDITIHLKAYSVDPLIQPDEFFRRTVGLIIHWPLGHYSNILNAENQNLKIYYSSTPESAMNMLYYKRIDILVMYDAPFQLLKQRMRLSEPSLTVHLLSQPGNSFVIPKSYPDADKLYLAVQKIYSNWVDQGLIDEQQVRFIE